MYDEKDSQSYRVMRGDLAYPIKPGDPGEPALQCAAEAEERMHCREEWRRAHPGQYEMPPGLEYHEGDYDAMERGRRLFGYDNYPRTFEPGDGLVTYDEKEK
jgi:hypothetical protein